MILPGNILILFATLFILGGKIGACSPLLKYVVLYCKDIALPRMLSLLHIPILLPSPGKLYNIYFCKVAFPISIPLPILLLSRRKLSKVVSPQQGLEIMFGSYFRSIERS